jgi:hypothetical protein
MDYRSIHDVFLCHVLPPKVLHCLVYIFIHHEQDVYYGLEPAVLPFCQPPNVALSLVLVVTVGVMKAPNIPLSCKFVFEAGI